MDGLLALVDEPLLDELTKRPGDCRLVAKIHRQVQMVPVAEDAEALEFLAHDADEARRIRATGAPEIGQRHLALLGPELPVDL